VTTRQIGDDLFSITYTPRDVAKALLQQWKGVHAAGVDLPDNRPIARSHVELAYTLLSAGRTQYATFLSFMNCTLEAMRKYADEDDIELTASRLTEQWLKIVGVEPTVEPTTVAVATPAQTLGDMRDVLRKIDDMANASLSGYASLYEHIPDGVVLVPSGAIEPNSTYTGIRLTEAGRLILKLADACRG